MAELKARFSLIDEMSEKLGNIADKGQAVMDNWEQAGSAASSAIDSVSSAASKSSSSIDGVVSSIDDLNSTIDSAGTATGSFSSSVDDAASAIDDLSTSAESTGSAADELSTTIDSLGDSIDEVSSETDYWTKAVGSYNKSALETVYTTEELIELGYKTVDAFDTQSEAYMECGKTIDELNRGIEASKTAHEELVESIEGVNSAIDDLANKADISKDAQKELEKAEESVTQAMKELESAQNDAQQALAEWDRLVADGSVHISDYETASKNAADALHKLEEAEEKASSATKDYSDAADKASESAEKSGQSGVDAITAIAETLIAKEIAEKVLDIAKACYELADAYSNAEKIIVNATGATGDSLDSLEGSMMKAYAGHSQDLNTTASAIGEINTRLGYTGTELENVAGLFLDYSRITNSDVVSSVQNVTKIMNQWGVEGENVESVLDRLAYAGQVSGISVDKLSQTLITGAASFQEAGLSLDSSIKLLADFELAGVNGSVAITALRTAVNNFSKDGLDSQAALQEVITKIATMENAADATALAVDTFGRQAGQQLALSIRNGTVSIESFNATLEEADGTLKKTAAAGETLGEKWDKSSNKMKNAFTSALQPTIDKVSSKMADLTGKIGDFLEKHPAVTKAIVAIGAGLAVAATAIAGVTFAVTVAIPAITAFGASIQAALGPIGWISLGATALVGGVMALTSAFGKSKDEVEDYNGTMEECSNEIDRTQAAYDRACELYGENSSAAQELADNLNTLHAQFDKGGGAIAIYAEKAEQLANSYDELSSSQRKAMDEIDRSEISGQKAVAMLMALSDRTNLTNADLDLMSEYANYLNDTFNCDIKVNYETKELTGFDPTTVIDQIMNLAHDQRYQKAMEYLSAPDFMDTYTEAKKQIHDIGIQIDQLNMQRDNASNGPASSYGSTWGKKEQDQLDSLTDSYNTYMDVLNQCEAEIEQYGSVIDETGAFNENYKKTLDDIAYGLDSVSQNTSNTKDETLTYQEAAAYAYNSVIEDINELCEAYDEAYQSAYESFQGQFGLFDLAATNSETYLSSTVNNAQLALDSQLAYWNTYSENIEKLKNESAESLGISEENYNLLMSYVQSGDEQAAGLAQSIAENLEQGNREAVTKLAETAGAVQEKQEQIANSVAEWQTDFNQKMEDIVSKAKNTVSELDLGEEATKAAYNTLEGYTSQLRRSGSQAVSEAQRIANSISAALSSANAKINVSLSTSSVQHNATGTTNADDIFVAGEEGPELIVGKGGSTVFPTSETNRIISALDGIDRTTNSSVTDNSTVNNVSPSYDRYDNSEHTEIVNNSYKTVENVSTYDDTKVIYFLDKFIAICSAIEKNTSVQQKQVETSSPSVSNHDESVTYGDTESIDNSRSYTTEYGDTFSNVNTLENAYSDIDNRSYENTTKYGDTSHSIENSLTSYDNTSKAVTAYDIQNALSNSAESIYSDVDDSIVEYGDMVRNYSDVENYGDNVKRSNSSENNSLTKTWNSSYDSDNSRSYATEIAYGDYKTDTNILSNTAENKMSANDINVLTNSADYAISNADTSHSIENSLTSYDNTSKAVTAYDIQNALSSAYSNAYSNSLSQSESYSTGNSINTAERYDIRNDLNNAVDSIYSNVEESISESMNTKHSYSGVENSIIQNALDNAIENDNRVIASSSENSHSDYAGAVRYDDTSYDFNYGGKTLDFSGDSYKAYSTSENNSEAIYSNSNGLNSIINSTSSNAGESIVDYSDSSQRYESVIESVENGYNSVSDTESNVTSVVFPVLENIIKLIENTAERTLSESNEYFNNDSTAELIPADVIIEAPDLSIPEANEEVLTAENPTAIILPPEEKKEDKADDNSNGGEKRIVLEIAGSGSIELADGVDKEEVLELLQENIKPVLMNIIAGEIYEEGDDSYDF